MTVVFTSSLGMTAEGFPQTSPQNVDVSRGLTATWRGNKNTVGAVATGEQNWTTTPNKRGQSEATPTAKEKLSFSNSAPCSFSRDRVVQSMEAI